MFGFVKATMVFVDCVTSISSNSLKYVSMNNQKCNVRPSIVNINSNEP